MPKPIILIAGGSGFIGSRLKAMLGAEAYQVRVLTRAPKADHEYFWDPYNGEIDSIALEDVDVVINLAGAGIADKRWTNRRKQELISSRIRSVQLLCREFRQMARAPKAFLSSSAIGIYGNSGEMLMKEESSPVDEGFMVQCCRLWESATDEVAELGIRTVIFRTGTVLGKEGGALAEVIKPLRFGLGAYFGDGEAWWSWIHRDDLCRFLIWAFENQSVEGVYNLVAPQAERGRAVVVATAKAMRRFALFLPAPAFVLRLIFGEMSAVILNSNRVSSEKLQNAGFHFKWPTLEGALNDIFAPHSNQ